MGVKEKDGVISWGHRAFFGSSWGEKVITPLIALNLISKHHTLL